MTEWSWGIVETRSNADAQAERSLQRLGYEPLVVRYKKLLRGSRIASDGRQVRSRKDELVERPFLPGYIFLPVPHGDDCTLVDGAPGVKRLFRHRDADGYLAKPKLIRARLVEQCKAAALEKDETPKPKGPARPDLQARLNQGGDVIVRLPTGIVAHLVSLDDNGRARYIAELMGSQVAGTIEDAEALELVDG